jgi:DNA polymerase-3 subunit beta
VHFTCQQAELHRALTHVSRAVARKSTLPVLTNVLLSAEEGECRLAATNLEIAITASLPARVVEPGRLAVRADLLSEFVSSLPSDEVTLRMERGSLTLGVSCGYSKANIKGVPPEDFPLLPHIGEQVPTARVDADLLREMIGQVAFAAATDDSRPVLAGVLVELQGSTLTLAAADGFRLSVRSAELDQPVPADLAIIVPARSLLELARSMADADGPIDLLVTPGQAQLLARSGPVEFMSRLIDGHFPEFRQIIPKTYTTRVVVSREAFLGAARRAKIFAQSNNDVVRLQLLPGDSELDPGSVIVSAQAAEAGDNEDLLSARVEGPRAQIAFNGRYLAEVLSVIKSPEVALEMTSPNAAGVFRAVGDPSFTHVVMPMVIGTI